MSIAPVPPGLQWPVSDYVHNQRGHKDHKTHSPRWRGHRAVQAWAIRESPQQPQIQARPRCPPSRTRPPNQTPTGTDSRPSRVTCPPPLRGPWFHRATGTRSHPTAQSQYHHPPVAPQYNEPIAVADGAFHLDGLVNYRQSPRSSSLSACDGPPGTCRLLVQMAQSGDMVSEGCATGAPLHNSNPHASGSQAAGAGQQSSPVIPTQLPSLQGGAAPMRPPSPSNWPSFSVGPATIPAITAPQHFQLRSAASPHRGPSCSSGPSPPVSSLLGAGDTDPGKISVQAIAAYPQQAAPRHLLASFAPSDGQARRPGLAPRYHFLRGLTSDVPPPQDSAPATRPGQPRTAISGSALRSLHSNFLGVHPAPARTPVRTGSLSNSGSTS
ncbi:hypothetical protein NDU88_007183 [Pleurodeles waltl]|uniref:Uncharacterized protein n=1 Tax=Pleurodeles waltl TaxID=8319 RepID=A0AAV7SS53_PLEWA|nr:hypothetical protein NDU88_007183 [Pleurodeles waltl]